MQRSRSSDSSAEEQMLPAREHASDPVGSSVWKMRSSSVDPVPHAHCQRPLASCSQVGCKLGVHIRPAAEQSTFVGSPTPFGGSMVARPPAPPSASGSVGSPVAPAVPAVPAEGAPALTGRIGTSLSSAGLSWRPELVELPHAITIHASEKAIRPRCGFIASLSTRPAAACLASHGVRTCSRSRSNLGAAARCRVFASASRILRLRLRSKQRSVSRRWCSVAAPGDYLMKAILPSSRVPARRPRWLISSE